MLSFLSSSLCYLVVTQFSIITTALHVIAQLTLPRWFFEW